MEPMRRTNNSLLLSSPHKHLASKMKEILYLMDCVLTKDLILKAKEHVHPHGTSGQTGEGRPLGWGRGGDKGNSLKDE